MVTAAVVAVVMVVGTERMLTVWSTAP